MTDCPRWYLVSDMARAAGHLDAQRAESDSDAGVDNGACLQAYQGWRRDKAYRVAHHSTSGLDI